MTVNRKDLLEVAQETLADLGVKSYRELYLTLIQKTGNEWRVNFSYKPSDVFGTTSGCFSVNIQTGEIIFSELGKVWKT